MIKTKKELEFYIMADRIMAGRNKKSTFKEYIIGLFTTKNLIIDYLKYMRKKSYYNHSKSKKISFNGIKALYARYMYQKLSIKLGFSIGEDVFGYGLLIPHYGTIVVNGGVRAGNYSVLHTCTCIGGANKIIGNALYLSSGAQIMGNITLGDNVSIAANSLVNKSFEDNILLAGSPASIKRNNYPAWYERDGETYKSRVIAIEQLKKEMHL